MKKILSFLAIAALLFSFVSCRQGGMVQGNASSISDIGEIQNIKIVTPTGNIREGCSEDSPVIQTSYQDDKHKVIGRVEDWYAVKLNNDRIGFVSVNEATPIVVEETGKPQAPLAPGDQSESAPINTADNAAALVESEREMLRLVNEARSQNGLPALQLDMELTNIARIKSQDMIDNNYFSHNSPTYGDPFDMMKSFGISYVHAGENLAGNQDVQNAHNSLMNSPGHRKNILSPNYTHIGIGVKRGGPYGNMFTQLFISKPQ